MRLTESWISVHQRFHLRKREKRPGSLACQTVFERALKELRIKIAKGTTNRAFLMELLRNEKVIAGGVTTNFVANFKLVSVATKRASLFICLKIVCNISTISVQ